MPSTKNNLPSGASDLILSFLAAPKNDAKETPTVPPSCPTDERNEMTKEDTHTDTERNFIKEWRPSTTQLLLAPNQVMEACDVLDHTFGRTFLNDLKAEIHEKKLLHRLKPAKTAMDHKVDDLMKNLSMTGVALPMQQESSSRARGDESVIIPRSFRSTPEFTSQYQSLYTLISSIENTAELYLQDDSKGQTSTRIQFDKSMTSVQLATYPGNGKSGYSRHCDTGAACKHECKSDAQTSTDNDQHPVQRIITAIYYITDNDWDHANDGGCLRIFANDNGDCNRKEGFHDIVPYADRLVLFRSDLVEHQVLPSKQRTRMALTVWLYGRIVSCSQKAPQAMNQMKASRQSSCIPLPIDSGGDSSHNDEKIFVSIPAYRDSETHPTILSLIENASNPDRVYVGVVYQYDTRSERERIKYREEGTPPLPWATSHLRSITLDYRNATGPCYARYLAQSLHRGEEYLLQIDSHMRFRPKWDEYLIQQLHKCEDPGKSVLTTYPPGYSLPNDIPDETRTTILVPWKFDKDGMLRQKGRLIHDRNIRIENKNGGGDESPNDNIPCLLFAGGFNFSVSKVILECPYDMHLPQLFFGEELSMAVRLYTNGYCLFAPPSTVCYHLWSRDHRTTFLADIGAHVASENAESSNNVDAKLELKIQSLEKVRKQLVGQGDGLGTVKTVDDFWSGLDVDFIHRKISKNAQNARLDPRSFVPPAQPCALSGTSNLIESVLEVLVG